jgi:hypothetical protein
MNIHSFDLTDRHLTDFIKLTETVEIFCCRNEVNELIDFNRVWWFSGRKYPYQHQPNRYQPLGDWENGRARLDQQ